MLDLDGAVEEIKKNILDKTYEGRTGRSGSNLQAGVEEARAMLAQDSETAPENKYVIILSDGAARMWYEDGRAMSNLYYTSDKQILWNSNEDFLHRYGENPNPSMRFFGAVWEAAANGAGIGYYGRTEDVFKASAPGDAGMADWDTVASDPNYYTTYETATYYAATSVTKAANEANVILVSYPYHTGKSFGEYTESFKAWLADEGYVTRYDSDRYSADEIFENVRKDLIYVVDKGSTVTDEMGSGTDNAGNAYDFDFINNIERLSLTVGGQELDKAQISENRYGFGVQGSDGAYEFELEYDPEQQDSFTWYINTPVTIERTVQLNYAVKLTNPQEAAGTYGVYDKDGSQNQAGLYTNNQATLYPIDSTGIAYHPEDFNKPTVSYTVEKSEEPTDPDTDTPTDSDTPSRPGHSNGGGGGGGGSRTPGTDTTGGPGTVTIVSEGVPLASAPELVEIPAEEVPLSALPKTGRESRNAVLLMISSMALAAYLFLQKKKDQENQ